MENERYLSRPPSQTFKASKLNPNYRGALCWATKILNFFIRKSKEMNTFLAVEIQTFEFLLGRQKHVFRNDKGYKYCQILLKTLKRFIEVNLTKIGKDFLDLLPLVTDVQSGAIVYLPTRQMVEFVLVKLYGCFKLLAKLSQHCRLAGEQGYSRIKLGHFWGVALNRLAVMARVWNLCKSEMVLIHHLFDSLLKIQNACPDSKITFLDPNYTLPNSLMDSKDSLIEPALKKELESVVFEDLPQKNTCLSSGNGHESVSPIDSGVVIQRNPKDKRKKPMVAKKSCKKVNVQKTRPKNIQSCMDKWKKSADVLNFVDTETRKRKTERKNCLTKKLDQSQWKEFRNFLRKQSVFIHKRKKWSHIKKEISCWFLYPELKGKAPG